MKPIGWTDTIRSKLFFIQSDLELFHPRLVPIFGLPSSCGVSRRVGVAASKRGELRPERGIMSREDHEGRKRLSGLLANTTEG